MVSTHTVLLISDDPTFRHHASRELRARGLAVEPTASLAGAVWRSLHADVDAVVIEATPQSEYSVVELVDRLRERRHLIDAPIAVCLSDSEMLDAHSMYLALRGCSIHGRPFNADGLAAALAARRAPEPLDAVASNVPVWS